MNEFIILPKFDYRSESILAQNAEDAMAKFAAIMDSDMNQYFVAISADKANDYVDDERYHRHVEFVTEWMKNVLMDGFLLKDETAVNDIAQNAFEIYCTGDGYTEYEALEEAYRDYIEEEES